MITRIAGNRCVFKKIWSRTSRAISEIVDNITFEDLVRDVHDSKKVLNYYI
jgi:DNA-binding IscR family transcriptional regulator